MTVRVQQADFDVGAELNALRAGDTRVGALASLSRPWLASQSRRLPTVVTPAGSSTASLPMPSASLRLAK